MEIIHLVMGKANPNRMNGVNKVVYQLASKQANAGYDVQVWGFATDLEHNYGDRPFQTQLFLSHSWTYACSAFKSALKRLDKDQVIFHLHGGWIPMFYRATKALEKAGLKYVITGHGAYNTIAMKKSKWKKKIYFQLFEKQVLRRAKAIHCIGSSEVTGLDTIYKTQKVVLMPYGIDLAKKDIKEKHDSLNLNFGFVGRLDYYTKGLDLMVDAFATYFKNDHAIRLHIIGDGAGRPELEAKITSLGLGDNVILYGSKYGDEKDELLEKMDVFLHPSRNEGMPSAVLEAASFGLPCIVTEATNIGPFIHKSKAGFVVPNENARLLALTMLHCSMIQKSRLVEMGRNAVDMIESQFNWNHVLRQFNQLYV